MLEKVLVLPPSLSQNFSLSLSKFCQMKINCFLIRFLPVFLTQRYLAVLGGLYYLLNRREKTLIRNTIARVFKKKLAAPHLYRVVQQTFRGIFAHYHEKLFLAYAHYQRVFRFLKDRIRFEGEEHLQAALAGGRGVILVTGHYGAVEFLPGILAIHGYPATMICRFQTERLRASLTERAQRVKMELIDADGAHVFAAAFRALRRGRLLIAECDEFDEWRLDPHKFVWFLGSRLALDRSLDLLQKRSGAPVVTALAQRNGSRRYTVNFTPIPSGAVPVAEQCLGVLEEAIQAQPEQWYQWKKFGKMIQAPLEVEDDHEECGYLAPEVGLSVPDQA